MSSLNNDPPPTYGSIFGELGEARRESSGIVDFVQRFIHIIVSTITCKIFLAIFSVIPVSCIGIGAKHINDCKIEPHIPIYLIVLGVFGVLRNILGLYTWIKYGANKDQNNEEDKHGSLCGCVINCFLVAWIITGSVWIYRIHMPSSEECNTTLYLFSFWLTTASYIVFGALFCCVCCAACCVASEKQ